MWIQRRIYEAYRRQLAAKGKSSVFAAHRHYSLEALSRGAGVDMEEHISYLSGLSELVTQPLRYSEDVVLEFYASL